MNRLTHYIFRQSLGLALTVTGALTAAFWLVQSLKLIELVVDRGVGLGLFIELMVLSLPQLLQLVVPVGCFIGVLFTYNKLISDSELVVMRACGASQWDLARPAVLLAAGGWVLMMSLSVYFLPASKNAFKDLQFQIRNQFTSGLLQEGAFNTLSDKLTVYVRARTAAGALEGLLIEDTRDPVKTSTFTAQSGLITQVDGKPNVLMINGTKEVWDAKKKQLSMLTFDRYSLDLDQFRDVPGARVLQPDERYLGDLFDPTDVADNPLLRRRLLVEGHNRLVGPLYCIGFVAVALASLLTGELDRRGQAKRLLIAIAVVIMLQAGALGVVNMADRDLKALPLLYLNALLPTGLAFLIMLRGRHWRLRRPLAGAPEVPA